MGVQEDVMFMSGVFGPLLSFALIVLLGISTYQGLATMGMTNNFAIRSDVLAASMSLVNMHPHTEVNLSWDYLPFSIGVLEGNINGGLGMFFPTETATFSSYPLTIPFSTDNIKENIHYVSNDSISKFCFKNLGNPEARME